MNGKGYFDLTILMKQMDTVVCFMHTSRHSLRSTSIHVRQMDSLRSITGRIDKQYNNFTSLPYAETFMQTKSADELLINAPL